VTWCSRMGDIDISRGETGKMVTEKNKARAKKKKKAGEKGGKKTGRQHGLIFASYIPLFSFYVHRLACLLFPFVDYSQLIYYIFFFVSHMDSICRMGSSSFW
jgi:hypothetical protein